MIAPGPCADCGNDTYVDDYCTVCGTRRTEPDRDAGRPRRHRAGHRPRYRAPTQRGRRRGGNRGGATGERPCGGGRRRVRRRLHLRDAHRPRRRPPRWPESMRCSPRSPACRGAQAAVLAGLTEAAKAAAAAFVGADAPTASVAAPTRRRSSFRPTSGAVQITVGNVGDSRVYWLPEPASRRRNC